MTVDDNRLFAGDDEASESVSSTIEYVERTLELDSTPIEVAADSGQAISGESSWAPGTDFTLRVRSSGDTEPRFYKTAEDTTVEEDGTWSSEFDFSDQSAGDTFTVRSSSISPSISADGEVVEGGAEPTETAGATETTSTSTPGFGVAVALVALLAAAMLAGRRELLTLATPSS